MRFPTNTSPPANEKVDNTDPKNTTPLLNITGSSSCSSEGSQLTLTAGGTSTSTSGTTVVAPGPSNPPAQQGSSSTGGFFTRLSGWAHSSSNSNNPPHVDSSASKTPIPTISMTSTSTEQGPDEIVVVNDAVDNKHSSSKPKKVSKTDSDSLSVSSGNSSRFTSKEVEIKHPKNFRKKAALSPKNIQIPRPCQNHSFYTDPDEVKNMETGLLNLLDDFNSGKLRAFGQGFTMEQMERIRDQQENLAKLHFEIGSRQDISTPLSDEGLRAANENTCRLMEQLESLSNSIGELNTYSSTIPNAKESETKDGDQTYDNGKNDTVIFVDKKEAETKVKRGIDIVVGSDKFNLPPKKS